MNSCQLQAMEEEFRFRLKHQRLIQEFLDLQKDFVSKRKKIQTTVKKRDALLAEVRFLRQKHSYLMDLHSNNFESNQELVSPEKSSMQNENVCRSLEIAEKKIKDRTTVNGKMKL